MSSEPDLPAPEAFADLQAKASIALFLDFDGTLVEIAPTPDTIRPAPGLGAGLLALSERLDGRLALISGRSIDDLVHFLGPLGVAMAGSHGAIMRRANGSLIGEPPPAIPKAAIAQLREFAAARNLSLEEKPHGAALHYRNQPEREGEAVQFAQHLASQNGLAAKPGRCVIELTRQGVGKDKAVRAFMSQPPFKGCTPIFIGDDLTDEDGFTACEALGGYGILVGERESTKAKCALPNVAAVHQWLEL